MINPVKSTYISSLLSGKGTVLAARAVETQGKGLTFAA